MPEDRDGYAGSSITLPTVPSTRSVYSDDGAQSDERRASRVQGEGPRSAVRARSMNELQPGEDEEDVVRTDSKNGASSSEPGTNDAVHPSSAASRTSNASASAPELLSQAAQHPPSQKRQVSGVPTVTKGPARRVQSHTTERPPSLRIAIPQQGHIEDESIHSSRPVSPRTATANDEAQSRRRRSSVPSAYRRPSSRLSSVAMADNPAAFPSYITGRRASARPDILSSFRRYNRYSHTINNEYDTPNPASARSSTVDPHTGGHNYPKVEPGPNPARVLNSWELLLQRRLFVGLVFVLNAGCLAAALLSHHHTWVFVLIIFLKSKDLLSTVVDVVGITSVAVRDRIQPPAEVPSKWILCLLTCYAESEEQIMRTMASIRDQDIKQHKRVMCLIFDGKYRDIKSRLTRVIKVFRRPYMTWKSAQRELIITVGCSGSTPVILIEKLQNAGKKDSLILCHDLFNYQRDNAPLYSQLLREEIWQDVLPKLNVEIGAKMFDLIFCTDADSFIHDGAVLKLANTLSRDKRAIAGCGLVLAEMKSGAEWSCWHLYQQFQYTFGQYVRRRAEGVWGRVTCLPGCVTMVVCRPEMAGAIKKYAEPVGGRSILRHQVQYLGTDRRLTYCMLSQDKRLHTLFVPHAVSETVAPQSLYHYLSQRRRWGSNAYYNEYFYAFGRNQVWITRLAALVDICRISLVYYRVANTAMFVHSLVHHFVLIKIIPFLVVTQTPTCWYLFFVMFREPVLRRRAHKLLCGFVINKAVAAFLSLMVFSSVFLNLGGQAWGTTGVSTESILFFHHPIKAVKHVYRRLRHSTRQPVDEEKAEGGPAEGIGDGHRGTTAEPEPSGAVLPEPSPISPFRPGLDLMRSRNPSYRSFNTLRTPSQLFSIVEVRPDLPAVQPMDELSKDPVEAAPEKTVEQTPGRSSVEFKDTSSNSERAVLKIALHDPSNVAR